jgi:hydroxyacylglutathione hydrolase
MSDVTNIEIIPILEDNYSYFLTNESGEIAVIDPGAAKPIIKALNGRMITTILNTHHHDDHIAANHILKSEYQCNIIGPEADRERIADMDEGVKDGDIITFGQMEIEIIETPGHTINHVCFYLPSLNVLFSGDTLFSMGCGRLFEGTSEQMYQSFRKLAALPDNTMVYCGHEYTQSNGEFCLSIEPENGSLKQRMAQVYGLRAKDRPTIPVSLKLEKQTNVFMQAQSAERFAELRALKDKF